VKGDSTSQHVLRVYCSGSMRRAHYSYTPLAHDPVSARINLVGSFDN